MKRLFVLGLVVAFALLVASAPTVGAAGAETLSCGAELASPGVYVLTADLRCAGDGLIVQAGDVTIELNGHSIKGPGAATATSGVFVRGLATTTRFNSTVIQNGTVQDFGAGIATHYFVEYWRIQGDALRIAKNGMGIVEGGYGISEDLRNTQVNNNVDDGIRAGPEGPLYLSDSQVSGNGGDGIQAHESGMRIARSEFSRNGGYGIITTNWGVYFEDNQANNNGATGIYLGSNAWNDAYWLYNNMANRNGGYGIVFNPGIPGENALFAEGNVARRNQTEPQCANAWDIYTNFPPELRVGGLVCTPH
jgi:hypothetical protein